MKSLEELRAIRAKMQGKVGVRAENENLLKVYQALVDEIENED